MAARAYWKGFLKLSLVSCPVALFPATTTSEKTHFHQISRKTGHRLRQQMVDEQTGKVVPKDDKGRGYELSKGEYVEIEPEELEAIEFENTHTLEITSFVPLSEIDRRYFDRRTMSSRWSKRRRGLCRHPGCHEARGADRARDCGLCQSTAPHGAGALEQGYPRNDPRFEDEVRSDAEVFKPIKNFKVDKSMVDIASHILKAKAGHFEPDKFKDEYEAALKNLVKRKAAGKPIKAPEGEVPNSNVIDLMEALQRSMEMTKGSTKGRKRAAPKKGIQTT